MARVHFDAFRRSPSQYLTAAWWRLQGKRVRARAIVSPLMGASGSAYDLWRIRNPDPRAEPTPGNLDTVPIVLAVDLSDGIRGLRTTLGSLPQDDPDWPVIVLDEQGMEHLRRRRTPYWLAVVGCGDTLSLDALASYSKSAETAVPHVIYADDDLLLENGSRARPHFKPDWNAELFRWHDFVTHSCIIRINSPDDLDGMGTNVDWVAELVRVKAESGDTDPHHIARTLHHRTRRIPPSLPGSEAVFAPDMQLPAVTAIIPTRNRVELLRACVEGLRQVDYGPLHIIVIDNDSDDPATLAYLETIAGPGCQIVRHPGPFNFSAMNNAAARLAKGEYLLFLNNDVEMLDPDWLRHLVRQAVRKEVGAVGARLLYDDRSIQHAGVVIGVGEAAAHAHLGLRPDEEGYFHRHNLPQFVSAVTAACLLVEARKFHAVGGFDETSFAVAFNDVDLCLKLNARGWQSFYEPRATLIHHESKSRGKDSHPANRDRFKAELAALKDRWDTERAEDPYHHPMLNKTSPQFVLKL